MPKFYFQVEKLPEWAAACVGNILPQKLTYHEEKTDARARLILDADAETTEECALETVRKECGRLFFLTGCALRPDLRTIEFSANLIKGFATVRVDTFIAPSADELKRTDPQDWSDAQLPLQLRLWQLAKERQKDTGLHVILLYQIIECECPNPPQYGDKSNPPAPLAEAKLLRHLFSHQQPQMRRELEFYCEHLGIEKKFLNPSGENVPPIVRRRIEQVRATAREMIDRKITRKSGGSAENPEGVKT